MKCRSHVGLGNRRRSSLRLGPSVEARRRHVTGRAVPGPERPSPVAGSEPGRPSPSSSPPSSSGPRPNLTNPVETIAWGGTLPSTRRAVLGGLSGVAIALGGNLGGVTSWLLGLDDGQLAGKLRADVLVPVRGAKRCVDYTYGFEFTYPASWLGDQTLAYRAAKRAEEQRGSPLPGGGLRGGAGRGFDDDFDDDSFPALSPSSSSSSSSLRRPRAVSTTAATAAVAEPVAAFGPPGTTGEENVSVIVAPITPGFSLQSLGGPRAAGGRFLTMLAPEGSGRQATLLAAEGRTTVVRGGVGPSGQPEQSQQLLYYTLEYTVKGPSFFRHNVSVYTARNNLLYTFNAQCPEALWTQDATALQAAAASFQLL